MESLLYVFLYLIVAFLIGVGICYLDEKFSCDFDNEMIFALSVLFPIIPFILIIAIGVVFVPGLQKKVLKYIVNKREREA